ENIDSKSEEITSLNKNNAPNVNKNEENEIDTKLQQNINDDQFKEKTDINSNKEVVHIFDDIGNNDTKMEKDNDKLQENENKENINTNIDNTCNNEDSDNENIGTKPTVHIVSTDNIPSKRSDIAKSFVDNDIDNDFEN